jgi:hypothetical protein
MDSGFGWEECDQSQPPNVTEAIAGRERYR